MIKIINYDKDKQKLSFKTDMSTSLANAIRRSILEIPVMAIDEVEISQNDSALFDEILAHRIGLVPIKTDKVSGKEIKFKLKKTGPGTVYSSDIVPETGTDYKLPLVILENEQEVELVATAKIGKGIDHVKYSPGLAYYRHDIEEGLIDFISIDENGKPVFNEDELKANGIAQESIEKLKKAKAEDLIFEIESWGQIEVKNIFTRAIEVLKDNLDELNKAVK
ncbi:MAG: hypothetical protein ACP5OG_01850 [Candidatus Nanoarchaeia archaeon]